MDPDRPHRSTSINNSSSSNNNNNTTSTTSELFICFTSRLSSSSSMKIPSKSILSPGRSREPSSQISLSSSLSRRLRSNGSMKGGQASPMFPTTSGKKRGAGFDNPEPSSPKVTCIGQVRVKTKKQGKKFRACRSKRRGEVSFRKVDHNNNGSNSLDSNNMGHFLSSASHHQQQQQQQECKKWVHLPVTICEALRTFGSEFNCFLPCRSSCMAKEGKTRGSGNGRSSCGFTRWLVAVQEGEVKVKEREIELVVDDDVERRESSSEINEIMMMRSSQRRHVFEDIEIDDLVNENMGDDDIEEGEARVSICIPPKNALLLMRCRSDPVKMAALGNKFWETPLPKDEDEDEDEVVVEEEEAENETEEKVEKEHEVVQEDIAEEVEEREEIFEEAMEHQEVSEVSEMFVSCEAYAEQEQTQEAEDETEVESTALVEETSTEYQEHENEVEQDLEKSSLKEQTLTEVEQDQEETSLKEQTLTEVEQEQLESTLKEQTLAEVPFDLETVASIEENEAEVEPEDDDEEEEEEEETNEERSELEDRETREPEPEIESKERESQEEKLLPECLLLMMCEPKLSMEVSKETWVCSTDFIRWLPEKRKQPVVKQKDGGDEPKRRISVDSNPPRPRPIYLQPPRSSCSFPAAPPMDSAVLASASAAKGGGGGAKIEHNHVGGKGYESFALTRCKSEPRRSSAKLAPDACCWKNRKLEPTSLGVGAAGVGF